MIPSCFTLDWAGWDVDHKLSRDLQTACERQGGHRDALSRRGRPVLVATWKRH
jgi:hypothetical protein